MIQVDLNKANPANFELIFPLLPTQSNIQANEELMLNIHGVVLPSFTVPFVEANWQGTKRMIAASAPEFEQINVQFLVDGSFRNWRLLYDWMTYIANNKDKMMENYSEYAVDSTLRVIDNFGSDIMAVKFIGMWPTNLQEVSFSVREGEVQLEGGATFVYDYFEVKDYV